MRRFSRFVGVGFLAACGTVSGCGRHAAPEAPDLAAELESDTGVHWTVYADPQSREIRFLAPDTPVQLGQATAEQNARAFIQRYREALHASDRPDELRLVSTATDLRGGSHLRFEHVLPGTDIPVLDSGTTANFTADGALYWLQTDFRMGIEDVDAHPSVTKAEAAASALRSILASCDAVKGTPTTGDAQLGVFSTPTVPAMLVYRVPVALQSSTCGNPSVRIDAMTGETLTIEEGDRHVEIQASGSRAYRTHAKDDKMIDIQTIIAPPVIPAYAMLTENATPGERVITHTFDNPLVPVTTNDVAHWDETAPTAGLGAAVDAHYNVTQAMKFLRARAEVGSQGRSQALGTPLFLDVQVYVHYDPDPSRPSRRSNAAAGFSKSTGEDYIVFGDGGFPAIANELPFSAAYDVVAHELAHLVILHSSGLTGDGEPGALDESFADAMGASAEHARAPNDAKNFTIGEDLFVAGLPGRTAIRNMVAPRSVENGGVDHTDDEIPCPTPRDPALDDDRCSVHKNSGIPSRAFSLIVAGGSLYKFPAGAPPVQRTVGVPFGIGWDQATEITYWAGTVLSANATFVNAALAQVAEASVTGALKGGVDGAALSVKTVGCAWYAVGVYKPDALSRLPVSLADAYCKPPTPTAAPAPAPQPTGSTNDPCSGHGTSFVCDPSQPVQALVCKNGVLDAMSSAVLCADLAQRCQPVSATDPTATVDADGVLTCE